MLAVQYSQEKKKTRGEILHGNLFEQDCTKYENSIHVSLLFTFCTNMEGKSALCILTNIFICINVWVKQSQSAF